MLTLRSGVMRSAKVSFLSVLSQVIVNLTSLNSGFLSYCKDHSFFVCLFCFFFRWHLKIQRYKGYISLLTANRLVCILCPVLSLNVSLREVAGKLTVDCLCRCVVVNVSSATVKRASKSATFFATLLQNELNSDVARFTTHIQTCLETNKVARW